ncbi:MAG: DUF3800 domain-containing protein [Corynebacterium aurimucosum]
MTSSSSRFSRWVAETRFTRAEPNQQAALVEKQLDRLRFPRFVVPDVEGVIAEQENDRVAFLTLCDDDGVLRKRVNEYCAISGHRCQVIADTVPGQVEFNRNIQWFTEIETPGFRSQRLLCVEGSIQFIDSRTNRGIQAADMASYILRRHGERTPQE